MTEQIKHEQFIWFLLRKTNNKTKSNCSLCSKTNNQNQFIMMTNNFHNPLTTVSTNPHYDVLMSMINNHTPYFLHIDSDIQIQRVLSTS